MVVCVMFSTYLWVYKASTESRGRGIVEEGMVVRGTCVYVLFLTVFA